MFLPKYDGLDLPEFDPDRPLLVGKTSFKNAAVAASNNDETSFLRRVRHFGHFGQSVRSRIEIAEAEFTRLGSTCGAYIVGHTFGLYPIEQRSHIGLQSPMVPEGYILAAEVDFVYDVKDICLFSPRLFRIARELSRYEKAGESRLSDAHMFDFVDARLYPATEAPRQLVFTDIEPMII